MDLELLKSNWALWIAAVIGVLIALIVVYHLIRHSAWGQLHQMLGILATARRDEAKALKSIDKAERIVNRLLKLSDRAKPRHVQEAKEALEDTRALAKIANDQVLIAENHVRRIIHEEYPPVKQDRLRKKHLPEQGPKKGPFSF